MAGGTGVVRRSGRTAAEIQQRPGLLADLRLRGAGVEFVDSAFASSGSESLQLESLAPRRRLLRPRCWPTSTSRCAWRQAASVHGRRLGPSCRLKEAVLEPVLDRERRSLCQVAALAHRIGDRRLGQAPATTSTSSSPIRQPLMNLADRPLENGPLRDPRRGRRGVQAPRLFVRHCDVSSPSDGASPGRKQGTDRASSDVGDERRPALAKTPEVCRGRGRSSAVVSRLVVGAVGAGVVDSPLESVWAGPFQRAAG
jgi:hypothetical protein